MFTAPWLIISLEDNFDTYGPISLELFKDEEPISTSRAVYHRFVGKKGITKSAANNLTKVSIFSSLNNLF